VGKRQHCHDPVASQRQAFDLRAHTALPRLGCCCLPLSASGLGFLRERSPSAYFQEPVGIEETVKLNAFGNESDSQKKNSEHARTHQLGVGCGTDGDAAGLWHELEGYRRVLQAPYHAVCLMFRSRRARRFTLREYFVLPTSREFSQRCHLARSILWSIDSVEEKF
jgi:hypothetical protein